LIIAKNLFSIKTIAGGKILLKSSFAHFFLLTAATALIKHKCNSSKDVNKKNNCVQHWLIASGGYKYCNIIATLKIKLN
jgi:hypothetical protein